MSDEVIDLPLPQLVQANVAELADLVRQRRARSFAAFYVGHDGSVYMTKSAFMSGDLPRMWEGADWLAAELRRDLVLALDEGTCRAEHVDGREVVTGRMADTEVYLAEDETEAVTRRSWTPHVVRSET